MPPTQSYFARHFNAKFTFLLWFLLSKTLVYSVNDAIDDCWKEDFIVPKLKSLCMSPAHGFEKSGGGVGAAAMYIAKGMPKNVWKMPKLL